MLDHLGGLTSPWLPTGHTNHHVVQNQASCEEPRSHNRHSLLSCAGPLNAKAATVMGAVIQDLHRGTQSDTAGSNAAVPYQNCLVGDAQRIPQKWYTIGFASRHSLRATGGIKPREERNRRQILGNIVMLIREPCFAAIAKTSSCRADPSSCLHSCILFALKPLAALGFPLATTDGLQMD